MESHSGTKTSISFWDIHTLCLGHRSSMASVLKPTRSVHVQTAFCGECAESRAKLAAMRTASLRHSSPKISPQNCFSDLTASQLPQKPSKNCFLDLSASQLPLKSPRNRSQTSLRHRTANTSAKTAAQLSQKLP